MLELRHVPRPPRAIQAKQFMRGRYNGREENTDR